MLELAALPAQHVDLRQRAVEQRLLLRDVESRRRAEVVPRGGELQRPPLQFDRAREHVDLGVGLAQAEVRGREIGGQHEARVLEIGGRLLGRSARAFDRALHAAEEVDLVADGERRR